MAFYITQETRAALRAAGCTEKYLPAMATVAESLKLVGDDMLDIIVKWKRLKPEWFQ